MALQVWLPFTDGTLKQQGISSVTANAGGTIALTNNGKLGKCVTFGTSSGGLTLPASCMTSFTECSIAFWIKINSWQTSYATFFQAGMGSTPWNNYIFGILRNATNSTVCFTISNGSSASNNSYLTSAWNTGEWFHMAFTYKAGKCSIYKNGVLDKEYTASIVPDFTKITKISIGRSNADASYQTSCDMNDFRIYNHCLSPMEVKQISQGLVLHYPLNRNGWGQENLLLNSSIEKTGASNSAQWFRWNVANPMLSPNHTYTLSFDAKMSNNTDVFYIGWANADSTQITMQEGVRVTNEYKRYSFTGQTTKTNINSFVISNYKGYGRGNGNNTTGVLSIKNIKLEEGSIATPWCPNSSDTLATTMGLNSTTEYDCSGFCNNGTRTGTFDWTSDTPKYAVSTYMPKAALITHPRPVFGGTDQEWTCAMWVKLDTVNQSGIAMNNFNSGNNIVHSANGMPLLYLNSGSNDYYNYGNKAVTAGIWTHVVFVFRNSDVTKLIYINGVEQTNKNGPNRTSTPSGIQDVVTVGYNLAGYISDYRVYATALSASDVKSLYQNCAYIDSSGNVYGTIHEV